MKIVNRKIYDKTTGAFLNISNLKNINNIIHNNQINSLEKSFNIKTNLSKLSSNWQSGSSGKNSSGCSSCNKRRGKF